MKLSFGMSVFWAIKKSEAESCMIGTWYHTENYVPRTKAEKLNIMQDMKDKRCVTLSISGTFEQVCQILKTGDCFAGPGETRFNNLINQFNALIGKSIIFDDIKNLKGTSISIDSNCDVEESLEDVLEQIKSRSVYVDIQKDCSLDNDILNFMQSQ